MNLLGYNFENPYILSSTTFKNVPAIYIVYAVLNGKTIWLDVGESDKLGERISGHERKNCWIQNALGNDIYIAVMQVPEEFTRRDIESNLRNKLTPICGEM